MSERSVGFERQCECISRGLEKFVQPVIPKFDGHYEFWSMTMENFLRSKEMWQIIEDGIPLLGSPTEAQQKTVAEAMLKDLKVKNYLF